MRKRLFYILLSLLVIPRIAIAQSLLGSIGIGLDYDAFIPDKKVLPYSNSWPFAQGAGGIFALKYLPENGFAIFLDATAGTVRIQIPAPGYKKSHTYLKQFHTHITAGAGPQFKTGSSSILIPYLHFGAGFFSDWGETSNNTDANIAITKISRDTGSDTWTLMCGAGLDWQFGERHRSGINLQISFTPMNIYDATPQYSVSTPAGIYDIRIQGRLLQCMLTYSTHFTLKEWHHY